MMNQSYPPDKSACNSPHPSSYSMISMPLEDPLINHLNETHPISLISLLRLYIYIPTQQSLPQQTHPSTMANQTAVATVQYKPFSTFVSAGPEDSKLMFRLIHFWEACNNSKGGILIETKYVTVDFFNDHHQHRLSHVPFSHYILRVPCWRVLPKIQ